MTLKVFNFTIGCKVNSYESNAILNLFISNGFVLGKKNDFDIAIINTCSVTKVASHKSRQALSKIRKINPNSIIVIMGCLMNNPGEYNIENLDADIILGTTNRKLAVSYVLDFIKNRKKIIDIDSFKKLRTDVKYEDLGINTFSDKTRAFLKIEDGCDNFCSYCLIPFLRGRVRSRDKESILCEVKSLIKLGYKEIVLTGIDTSSYGKEFKNYNFSNLLEDILENNKDLYRLRISSLEISEIDDKFLNILKKYNNVCDHLHIPLQSGCDKILKLMNRKYNCDEYLSKINEIRKIRPNISITTDLIVGFPSESENDFLTSLEFIKKVRFANIHYFPYSKRDGTAASKLVDLPFNIKKEREAKLEKVVNNLKENYIKKFIGTEVEILLETNNSGHSSNYLLVKANGKAGDIVKVNLKEENIL